MDRENSPNKIEYLFATETRTLNGTGKKLQQRYTLSFTKLKVKNWSLFNIINKDFLSNQRHIES